MTSSPTRTLRSSLAGTGIRLEDFTASTAPSATPDLDKMDADTHDTEESIPEESTAVEGDLIVPDDESAGQSAGSSRNPSCETTRTGPRVSSRYIENMDKAVEAVREQRMTIRRAALEFKVPKSTLQNRLNGQHMKAVGGQRKFDEQQEAVLIRIMENLMKLGFPLDRKDLVRAMVTLAQEEGVPFKNFSARWYRAFLARYKNVSSRIFQRKNNRVEKKWNSSRCERWISSLEGLKTAGYLEDPAGFWCISEFEVGLKEVYQKKEEEDDLQNLKNTKNSKKNFENSKKNSEISKKISENFENFGEVTIRVCANSVGNFVAPFFSYDGENDSIHESVNVARLEWTAHPKDGIQEEDVFAEYFKQEVLPAMLSEKNVLILDESMYAGNPSFIRTLFESGKDIRVLCYPYSQSRRLQPLGKPEIKNIQKALHDYVSQLRQAEPDTEVSVKSFPDHLLALWPQLAMGEAVIVGLQKTGLYPLAPPLVRTTVAPPLDPNRHIKRSRKQRREETVIRESLSRLGMDKKKIRSVLAGIRKVASLETTGEGVASPSVSPAKVLLDKVYPPPKKARSHHKKKIQPTMAVADSATSEDPANSEDPADSVDPGSSAAALSEFIC